MKKWWLAVGVLLAALWALLKDRNPWKGRAEKAQQDASAAKHEVIDAKADAAQEVNSHEAEQAHAELGALSDADLFDDALDRQRPDSGD